MSICAFKMQLKPGAVDEYRRRHDEIWPELSALLSSAGIYDYSIFLDENTLSLFAVLKLREDNDRDALPERLSDHIRQYDAGALDALIELQIAELSVLAEIENGKLVRRRSCEVRHEVQVGAGDHRVC